MNIRTGLGYDIHKLAKGRKLFIGGVEIPFTNGLEGHSDGDVLLHAICDALLGAIGRGDIGEHFPNTDKKYKDISSLKLLDTVCALVKKEKYKIVNIDCVVQAEEPKLKEYKPAMARAISERLHIDHSCVNIKATTQEGLGAIGHKEGIAAFATVLVIKE